jgi:WD40 repeat protein
LRDCPAFNDRNWKILNGNLCAELLSDIASDGTVAVSFSESSKQLVTATRSGVVTLWDTATASRINASLMKVDEDKIESCLFSACGTIVVAGTRGGQVLVWKIRCACPSTHCVWPLLIKPRNRSLIS